METAPPAAVQPPAPAGKPESVWLVVALREMAVKLRNRGFLISTAATLALILGALGLQVYLGSVANKVDVAVTGAQGPELLRQAVAAASAAGEDVKFTAKPYDSPDAVRAAVSAGDIEVGLLPAGDSWTLVGKTDRNSLASTWIGAAAAQNALQRNATAAGTTTAQLSQGAEVGYQLLAPSDTPRAVVMAATYVFGFLFYLAAVLLGVALATSIVEEKQNRVVEIIASSIRLRDLLIGKIVGNTVMALGQIVLLAAFGVAGSLAMGESEALRQIAPALGWFIAFYAVGIAVLACIYAVAGAISSRVEDIQSSTTPVSLIVALVFIAGISVSGPVREILSFIPLASTITMPGRIVAGEVAWWEPVAALTASVVVGSLIILAGERIYRRALMQTGGKLTIRQALKLAE
ncbi:ABC transporter permease [Actinoplanes sp. N902-109]|uniref:ABC transporter permease n=1 Tax=Actinoplanes sp. (strain N902-109) TaxID=649831 RepID=UPI0018DCE77D|nr:ABC transporter permease [Actinoplanes sp. N902-109]